MKNVYQEQVCLIGIKGSKAAQKVRMQKSQMKAMLTDFLYAKDIIDHEFVPEKQTVNGKFYKEVIKRLVTRVHHVRPEFQEIESGFLLHNNTLAHSLDVISEFLAKRGIPVLSNPPYSPDLFSADIFYFLN
jgi:hypothetical protein